MLLFVSPEGNYCPLRSKLVTLMPESRFHDLEFHIITALGEARLVGFPHMALIHCDFSGKASSSKSNRRGFCFAMFQFPDVTHGIKWEKERKPLLAQRKYFILKIIYTLFQKSGMFKNGSTLMECFLVLWCLQTNDSLLLPDLTVWFASQPLWIV